MKVKNDPRHQKRVAAMKQLFSQSFRGSSQLTAIDNLISACAPEWPLAQINKIDLAILRLSLKELQEGSTPHKVVIDEAVELAKEYGSEKSAQFVNGVLGSALEKIPHDAPYTD